MNKPNLFEATVNFPDPDAQERFASLIGLDDVKERLDKETEAILRPDLLEQWSKELYGARLPALNLLQRRPALFIFAGDVGTGKTALASSFGDPLARKSRLPVELYSLSLRARGIGAVGEMTALISEAFRHLKTICPKSPGYGKKPTGAVILVIDEADALAQSREMAQMHHEDRAGVNALIRGIDDLAAAKLPCLTVMCTNRLGALDPAVRRRAAAVFEFNRPGLELRQRLLEEQLAGSGLTPSNIKELAEHLDATKQHPYGYTFSDITDRFIPSLVLAAYPKGRITLPLALRIIADNAPTPPFKEA
jgi:AAA+ superfamily predicted ATPase